MTNNIYCPNPLVCEVAPPRYTVPNRINAKATYSFYWSLRLVVGISGTAHWPQTPGLQSLFFAGDCIRLAEAGTGTGTSSR